MRRAIRRIGLAWAAACLAACGAFGSSSTRSPDGDAGDLGDSATPDGHAENDATIDEAGSTPDGGCNGDASCTRVVFVTSASYKPANAGFTSVNGGDGKCFTLANAQGLIKKGPFIAWLSDGTISPEARMSKSDFTYVRTDGVVVATSWSQLTSRDLYAPIDVDETGAKVDGGSVWTGTDAKGTSTTLNCGKWANAAAGSGTIGIFSTTGPAWTFGGSSSCLGASRLYCFEQ